MRRSSRHGCAFLGAAIFVILMTGAVVTGCGDGSPTSPDQTPSPSPGPSPSPSPTPAPSGLALASISLSQSSVQGQQQPSGIVSLTTAAPASGVVVQLQSSNTTVAQVPATVLVVGGQSSATFTITTSTVGASSAVTISANYGGAARSATLTVTPVGLEAAFSVVSPTKGNDACLYGPGTDEADCVLDASASKGSIDRYIWTYWTGGTVIGHSTPQARSALQLDTECRFFENARGGDDASGNKYIQMTVELVIQDRNNVRVGPVRRAIRLYPNRLCSFTY
jgi:hypothetical protein